MENGYEAATDRGPSAADWIFYGIIACFAGLQALFAVRSVGLISGEAYNVELARSIVHGLPYGFNSLPESRFPPGLPLIIAGIASIAGWGLQAMVRGMTVFTVLAFGAYYSLLRRMEGRLAAGLICLLLLASFQVFSFCTHSLDSERPFIWCASLMLAASIRLESASSPHEVSRLRVLVVLGLLGSILMRSSSIALVGGLVLWLGAAAVFQGREQWVRLKPFVPIAAVGAMLQALWMYRGARVRVSEWPLNGYPGSYFTELMLKAGNSPEMGNATAWDFVTRVGRNSVDYSNGLMSAVLPVDYLLPLWSSPTAVLPIVLIGLGLFSSFRRNGGGLVEWYFICFMAMSLAWPWQYEIRFLLPVAPLALLYIWRGLREVGHLVSERPRTIGLAALPAMILLAWVTWDRGAPIGGLQVKLATLFWVAGAVTSLLLLRGEVPSWLQVPRARQWLTVEVDWYHGRRITGAHLMGVAVVLPLVWLGTLGLIRKGPADATVDLTRNYDVQAATYINLHAPKDAVIMARQFDLVYAYTRRRVVWFPPISNPETLMAGIARHKVNVVIVVERYFNYFQPGESECFQALIQKYPAEFELIDREARFSIYRVSGQPALEGHPAS